MVVKTHTDIYFSIVIPLYNKESSIIKTLQAVLNQTHYNFEVLVVNDGSTDNSVQQVKSIGSDKIRIIQQNNQGVCAARNKGIKEATYPYIAFLDADDYWEITYLQEHVKLINDFPLAAMWSCGYDEIVNGKRTYLNHVLPEGFRGYVENYFDIKRHSDLFHSSSVVIRKEAFDKAGYFDERIKYSEDLDMWYRIILNYPVVFYHHFLVSYDQDSENRAMHRKCKLIYFLPYYIDKYDGYKHHISFTKFIQNWSAIYIRNYYFNKPEERVDAKIAASKLDYHYLPFKYTLMLKTPFWFGKLVYIITSFKQRLVKNSI